MSAGFNQSGCKCCPGDNGCANCGDCCFDRESYAQTTLGYAPGSFEGVACQTCLEDLVTWATQNVPYDLEEGCSYKLVDGDNTLVVSGGTIGWSAHAFNATCDVSITQIGNCCGTNVSEEPPTGTWACIGVSSGSFTGSLSVVIANNHCCKCGETCVKTADASNATCEAITGINKCVGDQQPEGGCGGTVSCNDCDPPLASVYHVVAHYICGLDTYDCEDDMPFDFDCTWQTNTPDCGLIILRWNGSNWEIILGCITGDLTLIGSSDQCDPTGSYTGGAVFPPTNTGTATVT